jgi:hypothetical protein
MDEATGIKHLTKGLNATAQLHMNLKSPETTETFLEALIKYDKWHEEDYKRTTTHFKHTQHTTSNDMQQTNSYQEEPYFPQRRHIDYSSQQYQRQARGRIMSHVKNDNRNNRRGTCWLCASMDHHQYNRPKTTRSVGWSHFLIRSFITHHGYYNY